MVKSMTGFGRCETQSESRRFTVELKSVNHRYLDLSIKLPRTLNCFESAIRSLVKESIERGKVDLYISMEDQTGGAGGLVYHEDLARQYLTYLRQMAETFGLENDIRVSSLSRYPDVFSMEEASVDQEQLWEDLSKAIRGAVKGLVDARISEGENLKKDLLEKLSNMLTYVDFIEKRSPEIMSDYRNRLTEKVEEALGDRQIDENRLAQEIVIYADKVCVDEETVRLRSHIQAMMDALVKGGSLGRKLDFIAQEMNREANTILSKANNLELADTGIALKTDIEKVREQIQNIE